MKNLKNILIIITVIAIICVIATTAGMYISNTNNEELEKEEIIVEKSNSEKIIIKEKTNIVQNTSKDVNVKYPEFQNLNNEFESFINSKIYKDINPDTIFKEVTEGFNEDEIVFFTYEADYDRYNNGNYISIVFNQYIHMGNGRPRSQKRCYVIDVKENATRALVDVVSSKTNYKEKIIKEINKQAEEMNIELIGGNGLKELSTTQEFYIKDGKLIIYFQASEIAATAVGELEFIMPFEFLDNKFII